MNMLITSMLFMMVSIFYLINSIDWVENNKNADLNNKINLQKNIEMYEVKYEKTVKEFVKIYNKNKNLPINDIISTIKNDIFFKQNWVLNYKHQNNKNYILIHSISDVVEKKIYTLNKKFNTISKQNNNGDTLLHFSNIKINIHSSIIPENKHVIIFSI